MFSYQEFIKVLDANKIEYAKVRYPAAEVITNDAKDDYVYLIVNGCVGAYFCEEPSSMYSLFGEGIMLGYCMILDAFPNKFIYKTITESFIYVIKKADIEYVLTFPENYPFNYFFMREISKAIYYKSLTSCTSSEDKLLHCLFSIIQLLKIPVKEGYYILPKKITTKILLQYSELNSSTFYKQLAKLRKQEIVVKHENVWMISQKKAAEHADRMHINLEEKGTIL
ncbi:Crp/Fnr family transcriptional regulator [Listeria costaricensis]|uniref:Crp/Fnr family transcriptional regulator n=1 Tax=Listeria costaricensis TaxID=2026604 RepID=UPI000C083A11|nr:Crp/Fnr family transcriptional regulator [Listeria costaricensis]